MGLLDRFRGESEEEQRQLEPIDPAPSSYNFESGAEPSNPGEQPPLDRTSEWFPAGSTSQGDRQTYGADQGFSGSVQPLTQSVPFQADEAGHGSEEPAPASTPAEPKRVEPVGEERLDALLQQARKGHSARDIEAVWDAIMTSPQLHLLQRVKGAAVESHAIESPIGPMLMLFTSKVRVQTLLSTKPFRNLPYAWKAAPMPLDTALDWAIRQRAGGVEAIEVNRGIDPGIATVLQLIPERFERVHGRSLPSAPLIAPDFEAMAHRLRLDPSAANQTEFHQAFFNLQRWFAIRDPKRPNQPAFAPIDGKPVLMLFTSSAEAAAGAKTVGRDREWPKALMTVDPPPLVKWMSTLPANGVNQAMVNHASAPFMLELSQVGSQWDRYRR